MKLVHFEIRIEGWDKHRFITVFPHSPHLMFFHAGGCPARSLCERCAMRAQFIKRRTKELGIHCDEMISRSGYLCFGFVSSELNWSDPISFLEKLLKTKVEIMLMWHAHSNPGADVADPPDPDKPS